METSEVKLMIGTPAQKDVTQHFYVSMVSAVNELNNLGIKTKTQGVFGSCYIEWARNEIAHMFMNDEDEQWTHLLFIDSDIGFSTNDVLELIKHSNNEEKLIVGGLYPKKEIDWNMVHYLVTQGCPPDQLKYFAANMDGDMFSPLETVSDPTIPVSVRHLPTGFMMINRKVFKRFQEAFDIAAKGYTFLYGDCDMFMYFQTDLVKGEDGHKHYVGEDTNFCNMWRSVGGKIWALPWVNLEHVGQYVYKRQMIMGNPNG